MESKENPGNDIYHSGSFADQYVTEAGPFPFTVIRECYTVQGELTYSGARIVNLIEKTKGTVTFKMISYKGIFQISPGDQDRLRLDDNILTQISSAIIAHS